MNCCSVRLPDLGILGDTETTDTQTDEWVLSKAQLSPTHPNPMECRGKDEKVECLGRDAADCSGNPVQSMQP